MALYLSIGIRGTSTELGIVDEEGQIASSQIPPMKQHEDPFADYITTLSLQIDQMVAGSALSGKVVGIDIRAPNASYFSGCIEEAVNSPWAGSSPIVVKLSAQMGLPVVPDNDTNANALGEYNYGATRGLDHFVEVMLDTGVGSGVYADGHLIRGYQGKAGELGHIAVGESYQHCDCGWYGCLEASVVTPTIARRAVSLKKLCLEQGMWSELCDIPDKQLASRVVAEVALATGDSIARQVFDEAGEILGRALAQFICSSAPQAFVLFRGVAQRSGLPPRPVRTAFDQILLHIHRGLIEIRLSALPKGQVVVLGAISLTRERDL